LENGWTGQPDGRTSCKVLGGADDLKMPVLSGASLEPTANPLVPGMERLNVYKVVNQLLSISTKFLRNDVAKSQPLQSGSPQISKPPAGRHTTIVQAYPGWDLNPHSIEFKSTASASWATRAYPRTDLRAASITLPASPQSE
jgi:hypothetical protein